MSVTVRQATQADVPVIHRLLVALAVNEGEPDAVRATPESLGETLFGAAPRVFAHVAVLDGAVVGLALWFETYSTWTGRPGLYLEDLFVADTARGSGAGRALFRALAAEARLRGAVRIDWALLDGNPGARGFYEALGACHSTGWQPWRIEGEALDRLANGQPGCGRSR